MAITVSWNQMIDNAIPELSTQFIQHMESLTGNRFVYGLDTPINVSDILDRVGIFSAIFALACVPNTLGIQQAAGFDMVNAWTSLWAFYRPTDQSLVNLLTYITQLQAAQTPGPVNRNSCGDIVSTVSGITPAFVLGKASELQTTVNSFSLFKNSTGTIGTIQVALNNPAFPGLVGPSGGAPRLIYSPQFITPPAVLPGYVEHPLLEPDPTTGVPTLTTNLLIAEDLAYIHYVDNHPGNVDPFVTIQNNPTFVSTVVPDDGTTAQNYLGQAAVLQAQSVANGTPLLSSVAQLVDQAVTHFAIDQRQQILDIQTELLQVYGKSVPVESLNDYANNGAVYAAQVIAAGNAVKTALFSDFAFWHSYDVDLSGGLSVQERFNAELGLNAAYYTAISDAALALYQTLTAELNTLINQSSGIAAILRPYLL